MLFAKKRIPVGMESFEKLRQEDYYYVDKTGLIRELLENGGDVNLFTRPRRFGKSLNMSMLRYFFEIGCEKSLFDGLEISKEESLCEAYMGKYPVVSVSLKAIDARDFQTARGMAEKVISEEARRLERFLDMEKFNVTEKETFQCLLNDDMDDKTLTFSLRNMTELLNNYYGQKVILLIDEYDVPLAKAHANGYYDEMVALIRSLLGNVLKTNDNLFFAVLTGCLRVAKESIFTGLNNFNIFSITDVDCDEYFGFTDEEVREILHYYELDENYESVKEWYDGYRFGNVDVYCPWDVIYYCSKHRRNKTLPPQNYWVNTSGNDVVEKFINTMGKEKKLTKAEMEHLINGEIVQKEIHQELTYKDLYSTIDNIWSVLFMTGYLTQREAPAGNRFNLVIPNREIRSIFAEQIMNLFKEQVEEDGEALNAFCSALLEGKPEEVERLFTKYMEKTISVRDTFVRKPTKENFYHGILLGILGFKAGWSVTSNREAGDGYCDILVRIDDEDIAILIEVKYAENSLESESLKGMKQINETRYIESLKFAEIHTVLKYAIACRKKTCKVVMEVERI